MVVVVAVAVVDFALNQKRANFVRLQSESVSMCFLCVALCS